MTRDQRPAREPYNIPIPCFYGRIALSHRRSCSGEDSRRQCRRNAPKRQGRRGTGTKLAVAPFLFPASTAGPRALQVHAGRCACCCLVHGAKFILETRIGRMKCCCLVPAPYIPTTVRRLGNCCTGVRSEIALTRGAINCHLQARARVSSRVSSY